MNNAEIQFSILILFAIIFFAPSNAQMDGLSMIDKALTPMMDDSLWTEISSIWLEGCTLVYTEVCVHSGDRYVRDLYLENFTFVENGIQVFPPSLEILNTCPSESAMVDIVLLLDFSTSMNDEVASFFGAIPSFVVALGALDYRICCVVFNGCPGELDGVWLIVRTNFSGPCTYNASFPNYWATNSSQFNCLFNAVVNDLYTWPPISRGSGYEDQYGAIVRANENLDFRDGALKVFILFTDERPIVNYWFCDPDYDETADGLLGIIDYCRANDIIVLPVTPVTGEFSYASGEDPSRAFYDGYPILAESTGGKWFYLYSSSYDSLATQIGIAIHEIPCCYLFRYREAQFCNDSNVLVISAFNGPIDYGSDDTIYLPPCPGYGEFVFPEPCGGITTCSRQWMEIEFHGGDEFFAIDESLLLFGVEGIGIYDIYNPELSFAAPFLEFHPQSDFHNWDTIRAVVLRAFDTLGCPIMADSCSFIVDLQPPVFFQLYPPHNAVISTSEITTSLMIYDSLAGVRWSEIGEEYFSVTIDGGVVDVPVSISIPYIYFDLPSMRNGDTVSICVDSIPDAPDYSYCPPNYADTCWTFYVVILEGPIAQIVMPQPGTVSACIGQEIWIAINDSDGVDSTTIVTVIAGDTFVCADEELSFRNDTLFFIPPANYWHNGEMVIVEIIKADDMLGAHLQNPLTWTFYLDFSPPNANLVAPYDSSYSLNDQQPILINIYDNLAGVSVENSYIRVHGQMYQLSDVLEWITQDSLAGRIFFDTEGRNIFWLIGDTIEIFAYLCDAPDTCGPNCAEYFWFFYLPPPYGCVRVPNPFTPNYDNINDVVQFTFPGLIYKKGNIYIFDIYRILIREIEIPAGINAKNYAIWEGKDKNGDDIPQGLYIYVIEVDGEVVCEGTITIAR